MHAKHGPILYFLLFQQNVDLCGHDVFIVWIIMYYSFISDSLQALPLSDTDAFKKGKPSDRELDDLALRIGAVWERLGIRLDIPHDVLEGIAANARDKPFQMLLRWRNTTTSATPYHELFEALCHTRVGLNNLAKEFCCKETT